MALRKGTRLGPYEIGELIGAGGMGQVYRARDRRIGRDVAVKILPPSVVDPSRVRRFAHEARAAGRLNHPGVVAVYDVGEHEGRPYVVSELLEGETLRERIRRGPVPFPEAIGIAVQIAHGLSAAHDMKIVHRDLKPENLFVRLDGTIKILDFGIAKLAPEAGDDDAPIGEGPTASLGTATGAILGTAGYMAPEQVRGQPVDERADLFSLGAILYELLEGRPAFAGEGVIERMHAVLKDEPAPRAHVAAAEPPELTAVVMRCLAKDPAARHASARELARELTELADVAGAPVPAPPPRRRADARSWVAFAVPVLLAAVALAIGTRIGEAPPSPLPTTPQPAPAPPPPAPPVVPTWRQLTFSAGAVHSARFSPDGRTVVYGASWSGRPAELFTTRVESPASRALGIVDADVYAISSSGELAIARQRRLLWWPAEGTLARVPMVGGTPRDLLVDVQDADWSPDGERLAVARRVGGASRIEYPEGTVLYETSGWVSRVRVSPDGRRVAFFDHPVDNDDMGDVAVVDADRRKTTLATGWMSEQGIAWSADGDEVLFSAASPDSPYAIHAVKLDGQRRVVARGPSRLLLQDVARDGRILVTHDAVRAVAMAKGARGDERDVSAQDLTVVSSIAADGARVLLTEQSVSGGKGYDLYLRSLADDTTLHVGQGMSADLSPDGRRTLVLPFGVLDRALLLPNGAGETTPLPVTGLRFDAVRFFPDGKRVLALARSAEAASPGATKEPRFYSVPVEGGEPTPLTPEGDWHHGFVSPDGARLACTDRKSLWVFSSGGGEGRAVVALEPGEDLAGWALDGRSVLTFRRAERPARVERVDIGTGRRSPWKKLSPPDPTGFVEVSRVLVAPDGRSYAYTYLRQLSTLYVIEGVP